MTKEMRIAVVLSAVDKMSSVIRKAVDGGAKKFNELSRSAFDIGKSSAMYGLAIAAPLGLAVKAAADYEKMNIALKTSFQGNEAAANKAFKVINDFAATTPYELEEVMRGFVKLKNMGLDPSQNAMTAYGNIASGMGKSLNDMVEAVADAATGEFERLKEFGIKASSQGKFVTFTFQGVATKVGKNSKEIEDYLKKVGNTKFAGGIAAQSKSLYGQISTLKDNVKMFSASIGAILIPTLKNLMMRIAPVMDRVQKWTKDHPKLTNAIIIGAAALAALTLAVSAASFAAGGLFKVISLGATIMKTGMAACGMFSGGLAGVTTSFRAMDMAMKANVIILIISLIATAAMLIYQYWDPICKWFIGIWTKIKNFFSGLWEGIKKIFSTAWEWIKNLFIRTNPVYIIYKNWDKIKGFFKDLWGGVKQHFIDFMNWILNIPKRLYQAGKNMVKSLWEGIKSMIMAPINAIKDMVTKIREYLPFSPAKVGPLRDLHRVKIVETIADGMKPQPMLKAMRKVTATTMIAANASGAAAAPVPTANASAGAAGHTIHYSPVIHMNGSGTKEDFAAMLKKHEKEVVRVVTEANRKSGRTQY